jgi:alanine dehydrogenase
MLVLDADAVRRLAPLSHLVGVLAEAFRTEALVPLRQVIKVPGGNGDRLFVSMPAFSLDGGGVTKLVTVVPENPSVGRPAAQAIVVVFSDMGTPVAVLDGIVLTHLRTGAASALASQYLSRNDSAHLALLGTGALAPTMAAAHCAVRPITRVSVWGRRPERAAATAQSIRSLVDHSIDVQAMDTPEQGVATADIVCCATSSPTAILAGEWLRPGTFVDLVGSFSPSTREADDDVVLRSRIFVDTFEGALAEAGDLLQPLSRRLITRERVEGELSDLVRGRVKGRADADEIILFKSVGTAVEDLAAAQMIVASAACA